MGDPQVTMAFKTNMGVQDLDDDWGSLMTVETSIPIDILADTR